MGDDPKKQASAKQPKQPRKKSEPFCFFNRELSWLRFNERVLAQALDPSTPLLERVKFLAIFGSNLDEFFMIRVSGLRRQFLEGVLDLPPDGMTPAEQLGAVRKRLLPTLDQVSACWQKDLLPRLREAGIDVVPYDSVKDKHRSGLRRFFEREIFPILTPLAFDPGHPFPHISNLSLNLAIVLKDPRRGERFARLKVPGTFPRLLPVPNDDDEGLHKIGLKTHAPRRFLWFEEMIRANLDMLFPGYQVEESFLFRVTRDADIEIEEDEADDLLESIQEGIDRRRFGSVVRLEIEKDAPKRIRDILTRNLELAPYQVYSLDVPIGAADLMELCKTERPDLKDPPFQPAVPRDLVRGKPLVEAIRQRDLLLYHPYDSFVPVVDFLRQAANDPDVLAIKQTLYRVGGNSPIVEALMEARQQDKQVAVLVELKARFDEENNIGWARALESAGVHVVYGFVGLKTHAKVCMVIRREKGGIRRYVHLGTGNYNAGTAAVYGDFGLLTCDPDIGADASELFNSLTGYSRQQAYRRLLVAPGNLRQEILRRIHREVEQHVACGGGRLAFKLNALVDRECIQALYRASQAGVKVDLQVRGICCLCPGVPGVSENIRVTSVVGRFLEHARVFAFHNGGEEEVFLGSADLMPRNLDRRVEVLFPVLDPQIRASILENILPMHLRDNRRAFLLGSDGEYVRLTPQEGEEPVDSQQWLVDHRGTWHRR
ncbi:polyphosphate kinase 1 [Aminomonas paucivorans]|uniref:polyphosphate kinase 1 n=1 Tax=Aminomonas paucivorans TaxID=81412 RepID=UPI00332C7A86